MKPLKMIRMLATVGVMSLALGACVSSGPALDDTDLMRWQTGYNEIRDMSPKWGFQDVKAFKTSVDAGVEVVFVDVRTPKEWAGGVIPDALLLNLNQLPSAQYVAMLPVDKDAIIAIYCKSGHRSTLALPLFHQLGYKNAISMSGGWMGWSKAGYPVTPGPALK